LPTASHPKKAPAAHHRTPLQARRATAERRRAREWTDGASREAGEHAEEAGPDVVAASRPCKRGIAAEHRPGAAFSAGRRLVVQLGRPRRSAPTPLFRSCRWRLGRSSVNAAFPAGSQFILGFNEPNFQSAGQPHRRRRGRHKWKTLQQNPRSAGVRSSSPAVNFLRDPPPIMQREPTLMRI